MRMEREENMVSIKGNIITMPLYEDIEAISPNSYLCTVSNGDKIIIDGNGDIVR